MIRQSQLNPRRPQPAVLTLEHTAFLADRRYRRELQFQIRQLWRQDEGRPVRVNPVCEYDDNCCRWVCIDCTLSWLIASLRADGECFPVTWEDR